MIINKFYNVFSQSSKVWEKVPIALDIEGDVIKIDSPHMPEPNISSHTFVDLMGYNPFTSTGKALLKLFKVTEDSEFQKYYEIRGGIIEHLALEMLRERFPHSDLRGYDLQDFKGFNQFADSKPFSGVVDLAMTDPAKMTVEVKSKDFKYHDTIIKYKKYPIQEVMQGEFLGELFGADHYMMCWGIISDVLASKIRKISNSPEQLQKYAFVDRGRPTYHFDMICEDLQLTHVSPHVTWKTETYPVRHEIIRGLMKQALDIRNTVLANKGIPVDYFNEKDFMELVKSAFDYKP